MRNVLTQIGYVVIAVVTLALTVAGVIILFSAFGANSHALARILIGSSMHCAGWWLIGVYRGQLQKVTRLVGGVFLGSIAAVFLIMGFATFFFGEDWEVLIGVFAVVLGFFVGQLAACCFSPKYADDLAERDLKRIINER